MPRTALARYNRYDEPAPDEIELAEPEEKNPNEMLGAMPFGLGLAAATGLGVYLYMRPKKTWKRATALTAGARFRLSTTTDGGPGEATHIDDSNWENPVWYHVDDSLIPVDWPIDDPYPRAQAQHVEAIAKKDQTVFPANSVLWIYA